MAGRGSKAGTPDPGFSEGTGDGGADLAGAAQAGLAAVPDQVGDGDGSPQLEGMDYGKVKFVGVSYDTLEQTPEMGQEVTFLVRGKVVGRGQEAMSDGHIRDFAKVKVDSVKPYTED